MHLDKLSKDDLVVGAVTLLLLIDLLFLPWLSVSIGPFSASSTATGSPDGWAGIFAVLAAIVLLADLAVQRFSPQTTVPSSGGSREATRFRIALVVTAFLILKVLFHISDTFNYAGFAFWLGIVLTIALVGVTFRLSQGRPILGGTGIV
jgi:hypothetical protein